MRYSCRDSKTSRHGLNDNIWENHDTQTKIWNCNPWSTQWRPWWLKHSDRLHNQRHRNGQQRQKYQNNQDHITTMKIKDSKEYSISIYHNLHSWCNSCRQLHKKRHPHQQMPLCREEIHLTIQNNAMLQMPRIRTSREAMQRKTKMREMWRGTYHERMQQHKNKLHKMRWKSSCMTSWLPKKKRRESTPSKSKTSIIIILQWIKIIHRNKIETPSQYYNTT